MVSNRGLFGEPLHGKQKTLEAELVFIQIFHPHSLLLNVSLGLVNGSIKWPGLIIHESGRFTVLHMATKTSLVATIPARAWGQRLAGVYIDNTLILIIHSVVGVKTIGPKVTHPLLIFTHHPVVMASTQNQTAFWVFHLS